MSSKIPGGAQRLRAIRMSKQAPKDMGSDPAPKELSDISGCRKLLVCLGILKA